MRYIRFLKTPRIVDGDDLKTCRIDCLITITSDLGDSFLPCDITLSAELWSDDLVEKKPITSRKVEWKSYMRNSPITFLLPRNSIPGPLRVRISAEAESRADQFDKLRNHDAEVPAVLSAWSAMIDPFTGVIEAEKRIERRLINLAKQPMTIWEETGESIARHLWDAGLTLSVYLDRVMALPKWSEPAPEALRLQPGSGERVRIIELGTGCGMVGIGLAQTIPNADVIVTDLSEAEEIARFNIDQNGISRTSSIKFQTLEWGKPLPSSVSGRAFDLVIAADCTYNPDSSPEFVATISQLVTLSPKAKVIVAMKVRHSSEEVFFTLMAEANFVVESKFVLPLHGDDEDSEEAVDVFLFGRNGKSENDKQ
ncbi:hypothetical protein GQ43DRAFT_374867 [Delitschia confertaspora ATCC 74209]|uniref:Methyltransferase-domain-containing protein n=1 Tax=Delitschia confertaspora ATCC 74209 TaxID=1513339 RepID=A0A9P4JIG7_9PLEO|nr:hypothetical protein GQ43DRAFT_374867 [Delitschia confertaspora ATCC 74209]